MQSSRGKKGEPRNRRGHRRPSTGAAIHKNSGMGRPVKPESFFLSGEEMPGEPYRYRACGLDGIFLLNGFSIEQHDGDEHVAISDVDGLHKAIGRHLVVHRKALSPKEVRFIRNTLGLTQAELAERLGNTSQSVARWEKGECEMPGASEKLLRAIFLISVMSDEEFAKLREFFESRLGELDELDEISSPPAQFELFGTWAEKLVA
jgi:DNA-binding transcriptional regulator YiaG